MSKLQYTFKTDTLFKMLFVKHKDLLKKLVAALLGIKVENIRQFVVRNEGMPPEVLGDKFCRLDIIIGGWDVRTKGCSPHICGDQKRRVI